MVTMAKKYKTLTDVIENKEVTNFQWDDYDYEAETLKANSDKTLEDDKGIGGAVVLRFFQFAANPETFKHHTPTAQQLFDNHRKGIEALLWTDGMKPVDGVEPRIIFSKDRKMYTFAVTCMPSQVLVDTPQTLAQLIPKTP